MNLLCAAFPLLVTGSFGCSSPGTRGATDVAKPIHLTAALISPVDVGLKWKDTTPGAAGHVVEWTADRNDEHVILATLRPDVDSFTHTNLKSNATCHYRVRAFYGPAAKPVEIVLPEGLSDADYAARFEGVEDFSWGDPLTVPEVVAAAKMSLRDPRTAASATPTDLTGVLMPVTVSGFKLTWTDRASDEDGYMLEMRPEGSATYAVSAMMAPDTSSFGYVLSPPVRKASVRVRAFYYGEPSNLESLTTGVAPEGPSD